MLVQFTETLSTSNTLSILPLIHFPHQLWNLQIACKVHWLVHHTKQEQVSFIRNTDLKWIIQTHGAYTWIHNPPSNPVCYLPELCWLVQLKWQWGEVSACMLWFLWMISSHWCVSTNMLSFDTSKLNKKMASFTCYQYSSLWTISFLPLLAEQRESYRKHAVVMRLDHISVKPCNLSVQSDQWLLGEMKTCRTFAHIKNKWDTTAEQEADSLKRQQQFLTTSCHCISSDDDWKVKLSNRHI